MPAYCTQSRLFGLRASNPDFWVINPEFDGITKLTFGRFKVRKGMYCGIYDTTLYRWLIPVKFAWIRQDRAGNYWVRRTINSSEKLYRFT